MSDEDWKKRQEELQRVPPRAANASAWPNGVRPIGIDEMDALGVDAQGMLYWHGKAVAIRRIELGSWELWLAVLATMGALLSGLAAMFPILPSFFAGH